MITKKDVWKVWRETILAILSSESSNIPEHTYFDALEKTSVDTKIKKLIINKLVSIYPRCILTLLGTEELVQLLLVEYDKQKL